MKFISNILALLFVLLSTDIAIASTVKLKVRDAIYNANFYKYSDSKPHTVMLVHTTAHITTADITHTDRTTPQHIEAFMTQSTLMCHHTLDMLPQLRPLRSVTLLSSSRHQAALLTPTLPQSELAYLHTGIDLTLAHTPEDSSPTEKKSHYE